MTIPTHIDRYEIQSELGRGGMAIVYLAHDPYMGRNVAIKVLPREFTDDQTFLARFEREAHVAAQMQHPHILPLYDAGEYDGRPYIVTAYMPGGTLKDEIERYAPERMPLELVLRYAWQIAEGLDTLHAAGIVHRDLNPSNVLIDAHGNLQLSDFGIAKVLKDASHLTGTGMVGTPRYMAPEMYRKGEVGPASDIYALGIMLYEMLVSYPPFDADTPAQWMQAHLETPVPSVSSLRPDLPEAVDFVFETALAKSPGARYGAASGLVEALRRTIPDIVLRPTPQARGAGFRWWWAIAGIVLVVLVVIGGVFLLGNGGTPTQTSAENPDQSPPPALSPSSTNQSEQPPPTAVAPPLTPEAAAPNDISIIGGGTGILGFNMRGLGYTVNVSCVMAGEEGCDPNPRLLPEIAGITPVFGEWSPDGSLVAFTLGEYLGGTRSALSQEQVYVYHVAHNTLLHIDQGQNAYLPSWSPDGTQLAYIAGGDLYIAPTGCEGSSGNLCTIGGKLVVDYTPTIDFAPWVLWQPDNRLLIPNPETHMAYVPRWDDYIEAQKEGYYLVTPDGADWEFLEQIRFPVMGTGYEVYQQDNQLLAYDPDTRSSSTIMLLNKGDPVYSPRHQFMVFASNGIFSIVNLASCVGGGYLACQDTEITVMETEEGLGALQFSPDGQWVAFAQGDGTELEEREYLAGNDQGGVTPEIGYIPWNINGDIYIMNVQEALAGRGVESITRITNLHALRFTEAQNFNNFSIQWQPAPIGTDSPTPTTQPEDTQSTVSGETGILGFNIDNLGYTIDVSCILSRDKDCETNAQILPQVGGITPYFGEWSPDGSRILFVTGEGAIEDQIGFRDRWHTYIADIANDFLYQIDPTNNSYHPSFSPDGQQVAYISNGDVYKTTLSCSDPVNNQCIITGELVVDYTFDSSTSHKHHKAIWTPEDRLIIPNPESQAAAGYYSIKPDGTDWVYMGYLGMVLSDGEHLLFLQNVRRCVAENGNSCARMEGYVGMSLSRLDGSQVMPIIPFVSADSFALGEGGTFSVSPDRRIAVISMNDPYPEDTELFLLDLACLDEDPGLCQERLIRVTENEVDDDLPVWSPDGSLLAFTRSGDIFIIDLESALSGHGEDAIVQLTSIGIVSGGLAWQPAP